MAVVQFSGNLNEGQTYKLVGENSTENLFSKSRRLGFSLIMSSLKTKSSVTEYSPSTFEISSDYGWNWGQHEVGPVIGYSSINTGYGGATSIVLLGVFYDYNFESNLMPIEHFFGLGVKANYTMTRPPAGTNLSGMNLYPHIFWKWFALGPATALRLDLGYFVGSSKISATVDETSSGFMSSAALVHYF